MPTHSEETLYVTEDLLSVLLDFAADSDPEAVSIALKTTPAADLDWPTQPGRDEPPPAETEVFSGFYFPTECGALEAVFGMELGIPTTRTGGRFLSHPSGSLELSVTDDLHSTLLLCVPPYETETVVAYSRSGTRLEIVELDATVPEQPLD